MRGPLIFSGNRLSAQANQANQANQVAQPSPTTSRGKVVRARSSGLRIGGPAAGRPGLPRSGGNRP